MFNPKLFIKRNSSTILTFAGAAGVVVTGVMAVKATPKALRLLEETKEQKGEDLTKFEKFKATAPSYIPAVLVGASTIACIFGANILNKRHQAGLLSAYALLNQTHKEYKNKVKEMLGEDGEFEIRQELAKDKYEEAEIEDEDDGKRLFYESYSQRYFRATKETVLKAQYEINKAMQEVGGLSLNVYFRLLGLEETEYGEYVGWSAGQLMDTYWTSWIDFYEEKVVMDDGLECHIINILEPLADFDEY